MRKHHIVICGMPGSTTFSHILINGKIFGGKKLVKIKFIMYSFGCFPEDGTDRGFRNVGIQQLDAGETPKRVHNRFETRRKFEIKKIKFVSIFSTTLVPNISHSKKT